MAMMKHIKSWLALVADRRGVTALEYALIAGILVVTIVIGITVYANNLSDKFGTIGAGV